MSISPSLLNQTFYPQTLTTTEDGMGGHSESWSDGTAFRGRLSSINSNERTVNNKLTLESTHKIFCGYQSISASSRIRNSANTRHFEIVGIVNPSDLNDHIEIFVKEIESSG